MYGVLRLVDCRVKANCLHVGSGIMGGSAHCGVFVRDPSPYLCGFRRKRGKFRMAKSTSTTGDWTRRPLSIRFKGRAARPLVGVPLHEGSNIWLHISRLFSEVSQIVSDCLLQSSILMLNQNCPNFFLSMDQYVKAHWFFGHLMYFSCYFGNITHKVKGKTTKSK